MVDFLQIGNWSSPDIRHPTPETLHPGSIRNLSRRSLGEGGSAFRTEGVVRHPSIGNSKEFRCVEAEDEIFFILGEEVAVELYELQGLSIGAPGTHAVWAVRSPDEFFGADGIAQFLELLLSLGIGIDRPLGGKRISARLFGRFSTSMSSSGIPIS